MPPQQPAPLVNADVLTNSNRKSSVSSTEVATSLDHMKALALPTIQLSSSLLPLSAAEEAIALLTREEAAIRRVIQRYVRDASTVDDVFQEVSLKVLKRLDSVREPAALRGWLFQLVRNACLDYLRSEDRRAHRHSDSLAEHAAVGDFGRNPGEQFLSKERLDAVRRALADLPESQREVIRLRVEENLDHVAIAQRLHISRQAVEVRLCRGRATLKARLDAIIEGEL